jgi:hypothetical protein
VSDRQADTPPSPGPEVAEAWRHLLDALAGAGTAVTGDPEASDIDVAEGLRFLLDVLGDQIERATFRRSDHPLFLPGITPTRKLFFDNPDTDYDTALVSGERTYRIRGQRGTATYLAFCVYSGTAAAGETRVANLADADMAFEADGSFEVTLSATEHPGNWVRLDPDAHAVFARQYFLDRSVETPARYTIEAVGAGRPDRPLGTERFAGVARRTAAFVTGATALAQRRTADGRSRPNQFVAVPGHGVYGTPDAGYVACWYELGPGEALVVEARPPRCRYWGVHLANRWGQSLDHRTRRTTLNARSAVPGPDGTVRVVVAHADPGEPNWLDTAGHAAGWVLFRWLLAEQPAPLPAARVVQSPGC